MTIKEKAIDGLLWSFAESIANQGVQFIIGIVLARILSPQEFGLIGMLTIFIAVSQTFIDSGFSSSLIRKKECTQNDYSTVFFFNLGVSIFCYLLLFVSSGLISSFFKEPQLKLLLQVLGIGLIFNSFGIIQRAILTKEINFKLLTNVTIVSSIISGIISIIMALTGFGVWSLVALTLCRYFFTSFFLWIWSKWRPALVFCIESFNELFGFGSKLLISSLIDTIYRNIYYLIIGKFFTAKELGFYTRADQLQSLPSSYLSGVIGRVSYPVLAEIRDNNSRVKDIYRKQIKSTMLVTFVLMLGMAVVAKPMIITLIGEKWIPSVIYLQLLCLVGMFYPLHVINLNMINVKGRSDLLLRLEIIKKVLAIPIIITGIFWGITSMILGMIVHSIIAYYINSYWSGKLVGYPPGKQIKDILPSFFVALTVSGIVFCLNFVGINSSFLLLFIELISGVALTILICELIKFEDYLYIKNMVLEKMKKK